MVTNIYGAKKGVNEMQKTLSEEENIERLFYLTGPVIYTPGSFIDKDVVYQFNLRGNSKLHCYNLVIKNRKMAHRVLVWVNSHNFKALEA